jgi:lipopolysaccharide export system protein LptC
MPLFWKQKRAAAPVLGVSPARRRSFTYSRFVRFLRLALPLSAAGLMALVILWPLIERPEDVDCPESECGERAMQETVNIRYFGLDRRQQPFTITASKATQSVDDKGVTYFTDPVADILLKDGSWVALNAKGGSYNEGSQELLLQGEVHIFHDDGYEFRTEKAFVNIDEKTSWGSEPVEGQGPAGLITAAGFRILNGGASLVFTGPAKLTINAAALAAPEAGLAGSGLEGLIAP